MDEFKIPHMGEGSTDVFSGNSEITAIKETYGGTAECFAKEVSVRLKSNKPYTLLDIGTSRGELLRALVNALPQYSLETIGIDVNGEVLADNNIAKHKIVASADKLPLADKSADVAIARYVLLWNSFERQKKILAEMLRVAKEFVLIEHSGADDKNPVAWREAYDRLFEGARVPKMKRGENFYSSRSELEGFMNGANIKFERIKEKRISGVSDIFITRYGLSAEEARLTKEILKDYDYFIQTDWVVYPS